MRNKIFLTKGQNSFMALSLWSQNCGSIAHFERPGRIKKYLKLRYVKPEIKSFSLELIQGEIPQNGTDGGVFAS